MRRRLNQFFTVTAACTTALGSAVAQSESVIELAGFRPEARTLAAGGVAVSELVLSHRGPDRRVWISYNVQDPNGRWYSAPARPATLTGEAPSTHRLEWQIPRGVPAGDYAVAMAVWNAHPESAGAVRLLGVDRGKAFRILRGSGLLMEEPAGPWRVASRPMGRGSMRPDRVLIDGAGFRLRLGAQSCDGAEMRTSDPVSFGTYVARMRVPNAPGSVSSFFLYVDVQNDGIGMEILNDATRKAQLVSWQAGKRLREQSIRLGFDPREGFHDYAIEWADRQVVFRADGVELARWTRSYPKSRMRVAANAWWPESLACVAPAADRDVMIQSIRLNPASAAPPSH